MAIDMAARDFARFQIDGQELESRRQWTAHMRSQVGQIACGGCRSGNGATPRVHTNALNGRHAGNRSLYTPTAPPCPSSVSCAPIAVTSLN
jgi:hypothetical protein